LGCHFGGAGHVVGAALALHGVTLAISVPGRNGPVTFQITSLEPSVTYSVPDAEVGQALSSTD
jgi:hypothetical protein